MNKFIYTILILTLFTFSLQAQTFDWGAHIATLPSSQYASANDVTADASGNVYIIGDFEVALDLNGDNVADITNPSGSTDAIFIAKYNNAGTLAGAMSIPGSGTCHGEGISIDNSGNIYVTGDFRGTSVDFDPIGAAVPAISSSTSDDIFLALA